MVKAPSQSGLHSKFKPWRRGKSANAKNAGKQSSSLKQQLRGFQRLQKKKSEDGGNPQELLELQAKMNALKQQMDTRDASEKERVNAKKSHKMRFIERQRTTRLCKLLVKQLKDETISADNRRKLEHDLWKLALDQVYVAHYPLEQTSYLCLFQNGTSVRRRVLSRRLLFKMASQRKRVLESLAASGKNLQSVNAPNGEGANAQRDQQQRVSWILPSQYERIQGVVTWSTDLERETFGIVTDEKSNASSIAITSDDRFQVSTDAQLLLEQQEKAERELDDDFAEAAKKSNDSNSSSSESDEEDDEADPLTSKSPCPTPQQSTHDLSERDCGDDDEITGTTGVKRKAIDEDDDDDELSTNGNSGGSISDNRVEDAKLKETLATASALRDMAARSGKVADGKDDDDDDDFLVDAPDADVFSNAKHHVPAVDEAAGDKSKGWATQRQMPGNFRKKQRR